MKWVKNWLLEVLQASLFAISFHELEKIHLTYSVTLVSAVPLTPSNPASYFVASLIEVSSITESTVVCTAALSIYPVFSNTTLVLITGQKTHGFSIALKPRQTSKSQKMRIVLLRRSSLLFLHSAVLQAYAFMWPHSKLHPWTDLLFLSSTRTQQSKNVIQIVLQAGEYIHCELVLGLVKE